jgi:osmotically-inducible protein OsmY
MEVGTEPTRKAMGVSRKGSRPGRRRTPLELSGLFRARQVRYAIEDGVLVLSGIVSSYYEKQQLQEVVMKLTRVTRLKNRCEVK